MKKPLTAQLALGVLVVFILITSIYCDSDSINSQIQAAINQKQSVITQKNSIFQSIDQASNILKSNILTFNQAKTNAADAYRTFFNQNRECQGNDGQVDIISGITATIPDDICLQAPVNANAQAYFVANLKLNDLQENTQYYQFLVDDQIKFNADYADQLAIYTKYRQIAFIPLTQAAQKSRDCLAQYGTEANQNPTECQTLKNEADYYAEYYNYYRGQELSFGRLFKLPIIDLDNRKASLQNQTQNLIDYKATVQGTIDQINVLQKQCQTNLESATTLINQRLQAALDSNNAVELQRFKIQSLLQNVGNLLEGNKQKTLSITDLANQLKALYP